MMLLRNDADPFSCFCIGSAGQVVPGAQHHEVPSLQFIGTEEYPLMNEVWDRTFGEAQAVDWANLVLTGKPYPIKVMIISGSNPTVT